MVFPHVLALFHCGNLQGHVNGRVLLICFKVLPALHIILVTHASSFGQGSSLVCCLLSIVMQRNNIQPLPVVVRTCVCLTAHFARGFAPRLDALAGFNQTALDTFAVGSHLLNSNPWNSTTVEALVGIKQR